MLRARCFLQSASAAAAIEFAIVCMPFFLLVFGVCETGRIMWIRQGLAQVAMTGARCMGVGHQSCTDTSGNYNAANTITFIQTKATGWGISLTSSNITLTSSTTCGGQSGFSQVTLSYAFKTAVQSILPAYVGPLSLSATACFPNAGP